MVRYRRNFLVGGTFFFTVTLADRRSNALVDHIAALRNAFRATRRERPFAIEAIVVLPDHLHAVLTLPAADADFSGRWRRIKGHFSSALIDAGINIARASNGDLSLWQRRFWSTRFAMRMTSRGMSTTFISTQSSTVSFNACVTGRTLLSIAMSDGTCFRKIGQGSIAMLQGDTASA
jgi:REP element-mobilizing transposase RayT